MINLHESLDKDNAIFLNYPVSTWTLAQMQHSVCLLH